MKNKKILLLSLFATITLIAGGLRIADALPYAPGATLDPGCNPGDANCTVLATSTSLEDLNIQAAAGASSLFDIASSSGLSYLHISGSGNIGIGTATPNSTLEVNGRINALNINAIRYANEFPGANAGAKIAAAIADLPSTGGTVDARGLEGAQTISNSLSLGSNTKPVTLFLGAGTYTLTGSAQIIIFNSSEIIGVNRTATNIVYSGSGAAIVANSPTTIDDVGYADLESFSLTLSGSVGSTVGISLQGVWYSKISDVLIGAFSIAIDANGTGGGSYDNIIDNNLITGAVTGMRFTGSGGNTANSNMVSNNRIYGAVTGILGIASQSQGNLILRNDIEGAFPGTSYLIDYAGDVSTIEGNWLESTAATSSNFTGIRLAGNGNMISSNEYALVAAGGTVTNLANNGAASPQIFEPSLGQVGINAFPAAPLYIKAASNSYLGALRIEGASSVNTWSISPFGSSEALGFYRNSSDPYLAIDAATGDVGIGTTTPQSKLDINGSSLTIEQPSTPASSSAACTTGMMSWDSSYVYVCIAANTWKRAALTSW